MVARAMMNIIVKTQNKYMSHNVNVLIDEFKKEELEGAYESVCKFCECRGKDDDGEQIHWSECPTLKEAADEEDANNQYQATATA